MDFSKVREITSEVVDGIVNYACCHIFVGVIMHNLYKGVIPQNLVYEL